MQQMILQLNYADFIHEDKTHLLFKQKMSLLGLNRPNQLFSPVNTNVYMTYMIFMIKTCDRSPCCSLTSFPTICSTLGSSPPDRTGNKTYISFVLLR